MKTKKRYCMALVIIFLCGILSGCSFDKIDLNHSRGKLPSQKAVNKFIERNELKDVVAIQEIYNKYTVIIYEPSKKSYSYCITTSFFGRIAQVSRSEHEFQNTGPNFIVAYRRSTPKLAFIRIKEDQLSNIGKILVRYCDEYGNTIAEDTISNPTNNYIIITDVDDKKNISNIKEIQIFNNSNEVIYTGKKLKIDKADASDKFEGKSW